MKELSIENNCTNACTPVLFRSLFNASEIKTCESYNDHWCALRDIHSYIVKQQETCMKPKVEKYFDGMVFFKEGIPHDYPEVINKEEQKRTLLQLYWTYQSKKAKKLKRIKRVHSCVPLNSKSIKDSFFINCRRAWTVVALRTGLFHLLSFSSICSTVLHESRTFYKAIGS